MFLLSYREWSQSVAAFPPSVQWRCGNIRLAADQPVKLKIPLFFASGRVGRGRVGIGRSVGRSVVLDGRTDADADDEDPKRNSD